jgi:DnaJ-class molecular chaperone
MLIACPDCGGDGGCAHPVWMNHVSGAITSHWYECETCEGRGEIEPEPADVDDEEDHF